MLASHGYSMSLTEYMDLTVYEREGFIEAARDLNKKRKQKKGA